jgi:flagellar assembly protein FliH
MSPGKKNDPAPTSFRVVRTTSSIMPRSLTPASVMSVRPSARPPSIEDAIAEVEIAQLRTPALEAMSLELAARTAELREVIDNAAEAVRDARRQALETTEESLVRLATAVARRIVGRELSVDPSLVREWIREGIASLASEDRVEVRVAPDLAAHVGAVDTELAGRALADVVVDPTLQGAQISIVGRYGHVDASFEARFAAVKSAIGAGGER